MKLTFARLLSLTRTLRANGYDAKTRKQRLQWVISKCSNGIEYEQQKRALSKL